MLYVYHNIHQILLISLLCLKIAVNLIMCHKFGWWDHIEPIKVSSCHRLCIKFWSYKVLSCDKIWVEWVFLNLILLPSLHWVMTLPAVQIIMWAFAIVVMK